jgi:hypothetical protein
VMHISYQCTLAFELDGMLIYSKLKGSNQARCEYLFKEWLVLVFFLFPFCKNE